MMLWWLIHRYMGNERMNGELKGPKNNFPDSKSRFVCNVYTACILDFAKETD